MSESELKFIGRQLDRIVIEARSIRDEIRLLREEVRSIRTTMARLEDIITMDVLDRLRALEARHP
jgi:hypothetical protein